MRVPPMTWCETCGIQIILYNTYDNAHGAKARWTHTETPPWQHTPEPSDDETDN
jgi:hypothetical protein